MKITQATKLVQLPIKMHVLYIAEHQFRQCRRGSKLGHVYVPGTTLKMTLTGLKKIRYFHISPSGSYFFALYISLTFFHFKQALVFTCLEYQSFENTVGKGEIARNEQFLLSPQYFLPVWITFCYFHYHLQLSSANSFSLEESKMCRVGKG